MTLTDTDLDALLDALTERARARPAPPLLNALGEPITRAAPPGRLVVASGDPIVALWGNTTFDQTAVRFASPNDRDMQWPAPPDGAVSWTEDTGTHWLRQAGTWLPVRPDERPPPVTSGTVQSFTDATGEVWVASVNAYGGAWKRARDVLKCSYDRVDAFTWPTGGAQAFSHNHAITDPYRLYDYLTGRLTVPISGVWRLLHVMGAVSGNPAAGQWIQTQISLGAGGVGAWQMTRHAAANNTDYGVSAEMVAPMLAGQTAETQGNASVAATGLVTVFAIYRTYMVAEYLGTG